MNYPRKKVTRNLDSSLVELSEDSIDYRKVPYSEKNLPFWRVKFDCLNFSGPKYFGLDINGEITFGVSDNKNVINLSEYDNGVLGVSRRHFKIKITEDNLVGIDLKSTNGTRLNGQLLTPEQPYNIYNGSVIALGDLLLAVEIIKAPKETVVITNDTVALANLLTHLAAAITSQVALDDVVNEILEIIHKYIEVDEVSIWLVDENTEELYLQAKCSIYGDQIDLGSALHEDDPYLEKVATSGKLLRLENKFDNKKQKDKGYLSETTIYIPMISNKQTIGVMSLAHYKNNREFSVSDERLLQTISQFAAIAVQNSREYEATNRKLAQKIEYLEIINRISQDLSQSLKLTNVYDILKMEVREHWNIETDGLWIKDKYSNKLVPFPQPSYHCDYTIGKDVVGEVAENIEPFLCEDLSLCAADKPDDAPPVLEARSSMFVPLIMQNEIIGVYGVFSNQEHEFDEEDVELLVSMAKPVASAIQNVQLFEFIEGQWATVKAVFNMLPHPIMVIDPSGNLTLCNDAFNSMLEEVQLSPESLETEDTKPTRLVELINGIRESEWNQNEIQVGDNIYVTTFVHASMVGTIILMQDVTDPIVGNFSWLHFQAVAEKVFHQSVRYEKPLISVAVRPTNLQKIIDDFGYAAGDKALKMLADYIRKSIRTSDILGRYQNDQFIILMPETSLENAKIVLERIKKGLADNKFIAKNKKIRLRLETGIAELDKQEDHTYLELIERTSNSI